MADLPESVRQQVFVRAGHRCEYCLTSLRVIGMPLLVDHILPKALGGTDDLNNFCANCYRCNEHNEVIYPTTMAGCGIPVAILPAP